MRTDRIRVEEIVVRPLAGEDEQAMLDAIEAGAPVASVLTLLLGRCAQHGDAPLGARAAALTVGERDALALDLRAASLPSPLRATMTCTGCGEALELVLDPHLLSHRSAAGEPVVLEAEGYRLTCRPMTGEDQELAVRSPDEAGATILARCVTVTHSSGQAVPVSALPAALADRAAACVLALDPAADTTLQATCPACGASVSGTLDAAGFVLAELSRRVAALPAEILAIARATGWREAEILAMPQARRRRYAALLAPGAAR
jgi:hypothetical protein